jgi:hypothetical protein
MEVESPVPDDECSYLEAFLVFADCAHASEDLRGKLTVATAGSIAVARDISLNVCHLSRLVAEMADVMMRLRHWGRLFVQGLSTSLAAASQDLS